MQQEACQRFKYCADIGSKKLTHTMMQTPGRQNITSQFTVEKYKEIQELE